MEVLADLVGGEAHFLVQRRQTFSLSPHDVRDEGAVWALFNDGSIVITQSTPRGPASRCQHIGD